MLLLTILLFSGVDTLPPPPAWVPGRMAELGVPGLAAALVVDGRVAWTRVWGRGARVSTKPADSTTVWPVASVGKAVTAVAVLRLAQEGRLRLDVPIVTQLPSVSFLTRGEPADRITPRHLLNHTSGLSNYLRDRERRVRFAPGERYAYSGLGYMYLQNVVEEVTGTSFDSAMARLVFEPLAMESSWFGQPRGHGRRALPHAPVTELLPPGVIMLGITAAGAWLLMIPVSGLVRRRWRPGWWHELAAVALAAPLAWYLLARLGGGVMATYFTALAAVVLIVPLSLAAAASGILRHAGAPVRAITIVVVLAGCGIALRSVRTESLPLPVWSERTGNAAASLRTTIGDLARFGAELASPTLLDSASVALLRERSVAADSGIWWSHGLEVTGPPSAPLIGHRGSTPGVQSMVLALPHRRRAVVVIANAGQAEVLVRELASGLLDQPVP